MAFRASEEAVKEVLAPGHDYDTIEGPSLTPFIRAANRAVTFCINNAANYGKTAMDDGTDSTATDVETWLAAGLYKLSDQQLKSSQAGKSSGQFRGQDGKKSEANMYLQTACMLDTSKVLGPLLDGRIAGASWLGKMPESQIPYDERNSSS